MSLQVWLPMTKDLRQQGLSDVIATSTGIVTLADAGKLGKCYQFNGGNLVLPPSSMTSFSECTIAFWVKINSWKTNWDTFFQAGLGSTPWNHYIFGVLRNSSNYVVFTISNGSTTSSANYYSSALTLGEWMHLTFIYGDGKCKIYINGILDHEYSTSIVPNFSGITKITIGRSNNESAYQTDCNMNDFRIYDHALSPMEVKELAKGLVLHYPLNREGWGQENLFSWVNNDTSITLNNYQNTGSFTQFNNSLTFDPSTTVGEKYTISFYARSPNGTTSLMVYNSNSNPQYFNFGSSPQLTSSLGTEWEYFTRTITNAQYSGTGTPSTNTNIWKRIEIYAPNKMGVQVKHVKVEKGSIATPWCPNSSDALATTMGLNSTTEYDCSGFCNNGTRTGTFSWTSDTPKYQVSTQFNGTQIIQLPFSCNAISEAITVACWGYESNWNTSSAERLIGAATNSSGWCIGDYGSENTLFAFYANGGYNTATGFKQLSAGWHHFVITFDGLHLNYYVDGQSFSSKTFSTKQTTTGSYNIEIGRHYGDGCNFKGRMSDVRIYATALSADEVRALYENSAYIDNANNVYAATYTEV